MSSLLQNRCKALEVINDANSSENKSLKTKLKELRSKLDRLATASELQSANFRLSIIIQQMESFVQDFKTSKNAHVQTVTNDIKESLLNVDESPEAKKCRLGDVSPTDPTDKNHLSSVTGPTDERLTKLL